MPRIAGVILSAVILPMSCTDMVWPQEKNDKEY